MEIQKVIEERNPLLSRNKSKVMFWHKYKWNNIENKPFIA